MQLLLKEKLLFAAIYWVRDITINEQNKQYKVILNVKGTALIGCANLCAKLLSAFLLKTSA
jgi:hypothetical protein